jgi:predicted RNA-binding Zn-ribbon protein involved in translation (DUF1610 family)
MKSCLPRFVCPKCGCEQLVEVRHEVIKAIGAIEIECPDDESWEEIIYDTGHEVESDGYTEFGCGECDYVIKDNFGEAMCERGELREWLTDHAEHRMANIKFTCPSCGGHQLDDNVKFDDEGFCGRFFCCHNCGEVVCDQDESTLRKILEWGQKCSSKAQQLPSGSGGQAGNESDYTEE